MAKKIDIGSLSQAEQDRITAMIDTAKDADKSAEAARAEAAMGFYYKVKDEIQAELLKKLSKMPDYGVSPLAMQASGDNPWSQSKILKQIASLPAKTPTTGDGFILAARNAEKGKPKRISKEIREKRKLARQQKAGRDILFDKPVSERKQKAVAKKTAAKPKAKPKSAGAMAVGEDGLTKHQRHESSRVRSPEQLEQKNLKRRLRRAAGKSG